MVNISTANILGGIGMLLMTLAPSLNGIPFLIGYVLLLVSFYRLSSALGIKSFKRVFIGFVLSVVSLVVFVAMLSNFLLTTITGVDYGSDVKLLSGGIVLILFLLALYFTTFYSYRLLGRLARKIVSDIIYGRDETIEGFNRILMLFVSPIAVAIVYMVPIVIFGGFLFLIFTGGGSSTGGKLLSVGLTLILPLFTLYGIAVYSSLLIKRAFDELADATNHNLFKTTGALLFLGAVLLIIIIGVLLYVIGFIVGTAAFFTAPKEVQKG